MPTFNAGGLASGLDTNTLIDSLVSIRSQSVTNLKTRKSAFTTQVSQLADIVSRLSGLKSAATNLSQNGVLGVSVGSGLTGLSASATSVAPAGSYTVQVGSLAAAAKQRSAGFDGTSAPLTAGNLDFSVNGTSYTVAVAAGASLNDVAQSINTTVSKVTASVISDGTRTYLSVTNKDTGYTIGGAPANALSITGTAAAQFGFTEVAAAANAHLTIDGLDFERRSNTITDALNGVTFQLTATGAQQNLVLTNDTSGTSQNLQKFVDAYNLVLKQVQSNLSTTSSTNRKATLAGDGALKSLQVKMQQLTSAVVGNGTVRTLADVGIKTERDGTLSIDSVTLGRALAREPSAVNALFATASTGMSAAAGALVDAYTNSTDGLLTLRTQGLKSSMKRIDDDIDKEQTAIDRYRELLVKQFTAMESVVSGLKAAGNYLTQQSAANSSKG